MDIVLRSLAVLAVVAIVVLGGPLNANPFAWPPAGRHRALYVVRMILLAAGLILFVIVMGAETLLAWLHELR